MLLAADLRVRDEQRVLVQRLADLDVHRHVSEGSPIRGQVAGYVDTAVGRGVAVAEGQHEDPPVRVTAQVAIRRRGGRCAEPVTGVGGDDRHRLVGLAGRRRRVEQPLDKPPKRVWLGRIPGARTRRRADLLLSRSHPQTDSPQDQPHKR